MKNAAIALIAGLFTSTLALAHPFEGTWAGKGQVRRNSRPAECEIQLNLRTRAGSVETDLAFALDCGQSMFHKLGFSFPLREDGAIGPDGIDAEHLSSYWNDNEILFIPEGSHTTIRLERVAVAPGAPEQIRISYQDRANRQMFGFSGTLERAK